MTPASSQERAERRRAYSAPARQRTDPSERAQHDRPLTIAAPQGAPEANPVRLPLGHADRISRLPFALLKWIEAFVECADLVHLSMANQALGQVTVHQLNAIHPTHPLLKRLMDAQVRMRNFPMIDLRAASIHLSVIKRGQKRIGDAVCAIALDRAIRQERDGASVKHAGVLVAAAQSTQAAIYANPSAARALIVEQMTLLAQLGKIDEAIELANVAAHDSPTAEAWLDVADLYMCWPHADPQEHQRRLDVALSAARKALELSVGADEAADAQDVIARVLLLSGQPAQAAAELAAMGRADPATVSMVQYSLRHLRAAKDALRAAIAEFEDEYDQEDEHDNRLATAQLINLIEACAWMRLPNQAFGYVRGPLREGNTAIAALASSQFMAPVHDEPVWPHVVRAMYRTPEQVATIHFAPTSF